MPNNKKRLIVLAAVIAALALAALACNFGAATPAPPVSGAQPAVPSGQISVPTPVVPAQPQPAQPVSPPAQPTQAPQPTSPPAQPTQPPPPTSPPQPTAPPNAYAPDPLGPEWSAMAFSGGKCYDLDALYYADGAACDVALSADGWLITPQNGALFSGNGSLKAPSLNDCKAAQMSADPIALMTDLYLCFKTNKGTYGFFVMREAPQSSGLIVFDAYLFP